MSNPPLASHYLPRLVQSSDLKPFDLAPLILQLALQVADTRLLQTHDAPRHRGGLQVLLPRDALLELPPPVPRERGREEEEKGRQKVSSKGRA